MAVGKRKKTAGDGREAAPVAPRLPSLTRARRAGLEEIAGADVAAAWLENDFPTGLPEGFM